MTTSSMFLNDTTNIDHAYIDEIGMIIGGSYRPKFIVSGKVDEEENVVIDFSTVKKSLKKIIDDPIEGYDHKLWWIEGVSAGIITVDNDTVNIKTPRVEIRGPKDIVKIVKSGGFNTELTEKLSNLYPDSNINIDTILSVDMDIYPTINSKAHMFRYVHGLKKSTSWGCQNIGHGHLSYIAAKTKNTLQTDLLLAQIAAELDNTVFVWEDNIEHEDDGEFVSIGYTSERGRMTMDILADYVIVLETETTIEHIVDYVANTWKSQLTAAGVTQLFVSEGLSKGACKDI